MEILTQLIAAGEKHHKTNQLVGKVVSVITILALIVALFANGVLMWIMAGIAAMFGVLTLISIKQHITLKKHDALLKAALPYAKEERFDENVARLKTKASRLSQLSKLRTIRKTRDEIAEYVDLLNDRVKPYVEKGEKNLSYEEKIKYTLNNKSLLKLRPTLRKLDQLLLAKEHPTQPETDESETDALSAEQA